MNRKRVGPILLLLILLISCRADPVAEQIAAGNDAFMREAYEESVLAYREAEQLDPVAAEPLYNQANGLYRQGIYTDSVALLPRASSLGDTQLESFALYNLGNSYFQMEQWVEAIEAYKAALRIDPDDVDAKYNLELALAKLSGGDGEGDPTEGEEGEEGEEQSEEGEEQDQSSSEEDRSEGDQEQQSSNGSEESDEQSSEQSDSGNEGGEESDEEAATAGAEGEAVRLTEEQARQLLETVGQGTMSLQERLQEIFVVPGPPPDKDW